MLQETVPGIGTGMKVKMLEPEPELIRSLPRIDTRISFQPFVNFIQAKQTKASGIRSEYYQRLIEGFDAAPELLEPFDEISRIRDNEQLLELVAAGIFPVIGEDERYIFGFSAPFRFSSFFHTDGFRNLFADEENELLILPKHSPQSELRRIYCTSIYELILEKFYHIKLADIPAVIYPLVDKETGLKRFFRLRYDRRFVDIRLKGELPGLQDCAVCLNTFRILDLEKQLETMPLENFELEGFGVWVADDVTVKQSVESIRRLLIRQGDCDGGFMQDLKHAIHGLVGFQDIEIGIMPFQKINEKFILDEQCACNSLVGRNWKSGDADSSVNFLSFVEFIRQDHEATSVSVIDQAIVESIPILRPLWDAGIRSYIIFPIQNNDGLLGLLEIGSKVPNLLNHDVIMRLEPAMPLISLALLKNRDSFNNRIEKLVKEKFTALQPSVEWKFADVAWQSMSQQESQAAASKFTVSFDQVYPLYGAIDIRDSSSERNHAIQKDLKVQLSLADQSLEILISRLKLALLEGLQFKNQQLRAMIEESMRAEDEVSITEFLTNDLEPVLRHLHQTDERAREVTTRYFEAVGNYNGYLYHNRREYEHSITTINDTVLEMLNAGEEEIQQTFPHYFEKYRTDGVEYNIYIGQSIAPGQTFDLMYLRNIRLWQLRSMAEITRATAALRPMLKVPLETTQLILIHNQPIAISFRRDERRFDVEGSYNIRYEVMKKRLDKVRIRDTSERLTQPGKIAMVYSNPRDAQEYLEYISFLQNKGFLGPGYENLELEELQGVRGLKALRVQVT